MVSCLSPTFLLEVEHFLAEASLNCSWCILEHICLATFLHCLFCMVPLVKEYSLSCLLLHLLSYKVVHCLSLWSLHCSLQCIFCSGICWGPLRSSHSTSP